MKNAHPTVVTDASVPKSRMVDAKRFVLAEIAAKWDKLSEQDLSALTCKDDLLTLIVAKYRLVGSFDRGQAQRDIDALLKSRHVHWDMATHGRDRQV
jgi:hypothetical protein